MSLQAANQLYRDLKAVAQVEPRALPLRPTTDTYSRLLAEAKAKYPEDTAISELEPAASNTHTMADLMIVVGQLVQRWEELE
ncbi:MAG TPA: hypothetical protein VGN26_22135 [Armatimonadota bacterium]